MLVFCVGWVVWTAAYVLFAGQFSADELTAAVLCGLVAALWTGALHRVAKVRFHFQAGTAGAVLRAVTGIPSGTLAVGLRLLRALVGAQSGEMSQAPFFRGRDDDPSDAGRRAVAVLAQSLAPDSFVARLPEGRGEIDIHHLTPPGRETDAGWAV